MPSTATIDAMPIATPTRRQRRAQPARAQADRSRRRGRRAAAGGSGPASAAAALMPGQRRRRGRSRRRAARPARERARDLRVVRDDDERRARRVELAQQLDDRRAGLRVQRAGRLVGEDDRGLADERAGDRRALALAAGELGRVVVEAVAEADAVERLARALAALRARHAGVEQAAGDVVDRRQPVEEVELLEDEAHAARAQRRQLVVGGGGGVEAVDRSPRPRSGGRACP